jgi:hypothetical protein
VNLKTGTALVLVWVLTAAAAHAGCVVNVKATIPLADTAGTITLPVAVNGTIGTFILDTGAQRSLVTEEAVHHLNLARDEWVGTTMHGLGGIESRPNADSRSLTLGGVPLARRTLNHDTSFTVGLLPRTRVGDLVVDGVLGRDFLSVFDLDIDVRGGRLALWEVHDCGGRFLPWSGNYAALPVTMAMENALIVPVTLDATPLRAMLDTGASASLVAAPGLFRLGLQPDSFADDPADQISGMGPHLVTTHRHTFRSLRVGGQTTDAPVIWAAPVHLTPIVDMLLGADWLADRRIWISFATRQMFVATP